MAPLLTGLLLATTLAVFTSRPRGAGDAAGGHSRNEISSSYTPVSRRCSTVKPRFTMR